MGTSKERRERLQKIPLLIKDAGGKITFGKLFAKLSIVWGVTKPKLWEYLETLRAAEALKFQGDTDDVVIELNPDWKP